jgi:hypothetical protein
MRAAPDFYTQRKRAITPTIDRELPLDDGSQPINGMERKVQRRCTAASIPVRAGLWRPGFLPTDPAYVSNHQLGRPKRQ